jgi:hypothetical protein
LRGGFSLQSFFILLHGLGDQAPDVLDVCDIWSRLHHVIRESIAIVAKNRLGNRVSARANCAIYLILVRIIFDISCLTCSCCGLIALSLSKADVTVCVSF